VAFIRAQAIFFPGGNGRSQIGHGPRKQSLPQQETVRHEHHTQSTWAGPHTHHQSKILPLESSRSLKGEGAASQVIYSCSTDLLLLGLAGKLLSLPLLKWHGTEGSAMTRCARSGFRKGTPYGAVIALFCLMLQSLSSF